MFKWALKILLAAALVCLWSTGVLAYVSPGQPTGFVNDYAGVLTGEQIATLEAQLKSYQEATTNEIAVVTIKTLAGDTIENYAEELFQEWGIGLADTDNGVLVLIAIDDRKMRIEVGYGLEPELTDLEANQIINQIMKPAFQQQDFYGGLGEAVGAIEKTLSGEDLNLSASNNKKSGDFSWGVDFIVIMFFLFSELIVSAFARTKSWWGGGVVGAAISLIFYFVSGLAAAMVLGLFLVPIGLLFDYLVSKSYHKAKAEGRSWMFFGGGRGGSGGGGFGGFSGGSSGGGGSSGSW